MPSYKWVAVEGVRHAVSDNSTEDILSLKQIFSLKITHRPRLFFWTPLTNVAWCLTE